MGEVKKVVYTAGIPDETLVLGGRKTKPKANMQAIKLVMY